MAEVVTTSLLRLVFDKLSSKVLKELGLLMGLDKELRKLESMLSTIQDVLDDAEARQVKEKALRGWLRKLKDVAYKVDDVLDEFATKAMKFRPEIEHLKVRNFFSLPKLYVFRYKIAHRVMEIRETLDEIVEERSKFHLREGVVSDSKADIRIREPTGSFVSESEVYGRQEDREKIVQFLIDMSIEINPAVLAIVGLGGLGKTTITQLVYNDERICGHFEERIWVCVSEEFESRKLNRSIIESITGREYSLLDMDVMQRSLRQLLAGKKFLLVLDDVWNENVEKWERLRGVLACGARGSKIIVTTRNERVASIMDAVALLSLQGLSEDDCWSLFEKRAFGLGGDNTPSLVAIGKEIVKKCGGVPLAAKALGSLMRFRRGECEWLAVKDNEIWKFSDDDNEILPALMLSFNHLPSRLKQCFAYCSIIPKGYQIRTETLVQLWIAEGFIQSSEGSAQLEDIGFQYVDELLSRSLFQDGRKDTDGVVRQVKMHDLVHDLARAVAGDECAILDVATQRGFSRTSRYLSLICTGPVSSILELLQRADNLRTFYFIHPGGITEEQDKTEEILHVIFSKIKLLRALHLSGYPIENLPLSVKKLKHLRYLNLSCTRIKTLLPCITTLHNLQTLNLDSCRDLQTLPDAIGDLFNLLTLNLYNCKSILSLPDSLGRLRSLQKLDLSFCPIQTLPESLSCLSNLQSLLLRYCYWLHELPENMKDMRSLVHLDILSCWKLTCMPVGIGQLIHLRTLPMFVLGGEGRCSIAELGGLNPAGDLYIRKLENVRDVEEATNARLTEKQNIRALYLFWDLNAIQKARQASGVLDDREEITVNYVESLIAQDWGTDSEFGENVIEALRPHMNIEVLSIEGYLGRMLPCWMMELAFPNLAEITLSYCMRCEHLPAFGQLPFLRVLKMVVLPAVKTLGSEFYGGDNAFTLLEELELSCMPELEEWSRVSTGEIFPRLSKFSMHGCPKLKALPSAFPTVTNLAMDVDDSLMLNSLQNGAFPNLESLSIMNCSADGDVPLPEVLDQRRSSLKTWSMSSIWRPCESDSDSTSVCDSPIDSLIFQDHNSIPHNMNAFSEHIWSKLEECANVHRPRKATHCSRSRLELH